MNNPKANPDVKFKTRMYLGELLFEAVNGMAVIYPRWMPAGARTIFTSLMEAEAFVDTHLMLSEKCTCFKREGDNAECPRHRLAAEVLFFNPHPALPQIPATRDI